MTEPTKKCREGFSHRDIRLNPKREKGITKFGNPIQVHRVEGAKPERLGPGESWERRPVLMDAEYQAWGRS